MKKFRVSKYAEPSEDVVADYYYIDGGFATFVLTCQEEGTYNANILSVPASDISRIEYMGEHTE